MTVSNEFLADFLRVARSKVGTREVGRNGGAAVRAFQSATWLEPGSWPWCAAFVCWVWLCASVRFPALSAIRPKTPRAAEFIAWGRSNGFAVFQGSALALVVPLPGDVVVFRFPSGHHIGIVDSVVHAGLFYSIEGNTDAEGAREGDGVWHKQRTKKHVSALIRFVA